MGRILHPNINNNNNHIDEIDKFFLCVDPFSAVGKIRLDRTAGGAGRRELDGHGTGGFAVYFLDQYLILRRQNVGGYSHQT